MAIKVIADGEVLKSLNRLLGGSEFTSDWIGTGDELLVYAPASHNHAERRAEHGGLKRLQQALAHPQSTGPVKISIIGFTGRLGRYTYLARNGIPLFPIPRLEKLDVVAARLPTEVEWRALTRCASEEELEIRCASYRHDLQSVMAAARIYLGAIMAGHIEEPQAWTRGLDKLQQLAQKQSAPIQLNTGPLIGSLREHQQRFKSDYANIRKPSELSLWVLDDEWEPHGWKTVFESLLPGQFRGFTRWEKLEREIVRDAARPAILILDCNLGEGDDVPTGLELLNSIRSRWADTKIVFATAYDDAALALTSLREGANVFFAKTLNDLTDRHSLDYYKQFIHVLERHPIEQKVSEWWKEYTGKFSSANPSQDNTPAFLKTFDHLLRLGFYLLFSLIDNNLWWRGGPLNLPDVQLFRAVVNLIGVGYPIEELARNENTKNSKKVAAILQGSSHGGTPIGFEELGIVLDYTLKHFINPVVQDARASVQDKKVMSWSRPLPDYWPYRSPKALQTDTSHPGLPSGTPLMTHAVADSQGAIELMSGIRCSVKCKHKDVTVRNVLAVHGPPKPLSESEKIVFIDDAGSSSGWFDVARAIFPNCMVCHHVRQFIDSGREASLIILDLRLPTYEQGWEALRHLFDKDPSVPVLAMSAGYDSLAAIRSIRYGAIDFVSKTLPGARDLNGRLQFADEFVSKCEILIEYGESKCREAWRLLNRLARGVAWRSAGDYENVKAAHNKCSDDLDRLPKAHRKGMEIPPLPDDWTKILVDDMSLLLRLRQQIFWLMKKKTLPPEPARLNYERTYRIYPIDNWRWNHILPYMKRTDMVKLIALLGGVLVDRMARWRWCLDSEQFLNPMLWGTGILITDEIQKIGGFDIWMRRNEATYRFDEQSSKKWSEAVCDEIIDSLLKSIRTFYSHFGASF